MQMNNVSVDLGYPHKLSGYSFKHVGVAAALNCYALTVKGHILSAFRASMSSSDSNNESLYNFLKISPKFGYSSRLLSISVNSCRVTTINSEKWDSISGWLVTMRYEKDAGSP